MTTEESGQAIGRTRSICPVCGQQLPAVRVKRGHNIYLEKTCPEHGGFSAVIWRETEENPVDFLTWRGEQAELQEGENACCPDACGLCPEHRQGTCCIVYEVTRRCNLHCSFCFADPDNVETISLEQIKRDIPALVQPGQTLIQLSGGEPTLRDDLPEIVSYAKACGCKYVQLNSNGLRLADDPKYLATLAQAGLSFVFMQFDGTTDDIYLQLRGQALLAQKLRAVENCGKHNIGVTLVPTLVPGVNIGDIENIINLGASLSPTVRGVHFQPVAYFGRYPSPPADRDRYTLGELLAALPMRDYLLPSRCDHPLCGFHGSFLVEPDGSLKPLARTREQQCYACGVTTAEQNREYVGRRWQRRPTLESPPQDGLEEFVRRIREHSFTITAMAFQDAYTLDIERLRRCSLHVYQDGRTIPFCARYLTLEDKHEL